MTKTKVNEIYVTDGPTDRRKALLLTSKETSYSKYYADKTIPNLVINANLDL